MGQKDPNVNLTRPCLRTSTASFANLAPTPIKSMATMAIPSSSLPFYACTTSPETLVTEPLPNISSQSEAKGATIRMDCNFMFGKLGSAKTACIRSCTL